MQRLKDVLAGALLFALLGPALGALAFVAMGAVAAGPAQMPPIWFAVGVGYVGGLLPAAVTGMVAGCFRRWRVRSTGCLSIGLAGASMAGGAMWLLAPEVDRWEKTAAFAVAGGFAALGCSALFVRTDATAEA